PRSRLQQINRAASVAVKACLVGNQTNAPALEQCEAVASDYIDTVQRFCRSALRAPWTVICRGPYSTGLFRVRRGNGRRCNNRSDTPSQRIDVGRLFGIDPRMHTVAQENNECFASGIDPD